MWRLIFPVLVAAWFGAGCGQGAVECSGGTPHGDTCLPNPGVRWTDAKATAAALTYSEAPALKGRLTHPRCRIVARLQFYEAESVCRAVFVAPNVAPRKVVVAFSLSGHGGLVPDCRQHWKSSPYCSARNRLILS
jgi:hypothetical protein